MNKTSITQYLESEAVQQNISQVLGDKKNQFIASVASLVGSNENLQNVDKKSLFSACLVAASLDLPINPNLGFAYIIPYRVKVGNDYQLQAQFQIGYKGFIQLCIRTLLFKTINTTEVREGELTGTNHLTGELEFEWATTDRNSLDVVGYVAYFKLLSGFEKSLYMTKEQLQKHGMRYSKSMKKGYGLWKDDFDSMAKKTVLKQLLSKFGPMTAKLADALNMDQTVSTGDNIRYIDNEPIDPDELAKEKERARVIAHIENSKTVDELWKCEQYIPDEEVLTMYTAKKQLLQKAA